MRDQLVSIETAVLCKGKGFNEPCKAFIAQHSDGTSIPYEFVDDKMYVYKDIHQAGYNTISELDSEYIMFYLHPTQSLAQRWMREKHKIIVWAEPDYDFRDEKILLDRWSAVITKGLFSSTIETGYYDTYELALEAGLLAGLNLIK